MGEPSKSAGPSRLRRVLVLVWAIVIVSLWIFFRPAPAEAGPYQLKRVAEGFNHPVSLNNARDGSGRVFVVEQAGVVRLLENGKPGKLFLDIHERVQSGGEMGLLSIAFHPKFRENGRCFVNYTAPEPGLHTVLSEFLVPKGADAADPGSERILLTIDQPYQNHNGGQNAFGPDGYLYIGMGDGGAGGDPHQNGQNLGVLLAKVLRIDVDGPHDAAHPYAIPPDNPFVKTAGARPEIWTWGMRNPWRFSFDRKTGVCWCGDVGQNLYEEIDILEKGKNYGWNIMEGKHCFKPPEGCKTDGLTPPVKDYGREDGGCVIGGYVYRGKANPELDGAYIYADFNNGRIWSLRYEGGKVTEDRLLCGTRKPIAAFGEDEAGELHVVTYEGRIWQLAPSAATGR